MVVAREKKKERNKKTRGGEELLAKGETRRHDKTRKTRERMCFVRTSNHFLF